MRTTDEITFNASGDEDAYQESNYGKNNDILHVNLKGKEAISLINEIQEGIRVLKPSDKSTISFTLFGLLDKKNKS
jgi:hypothetical protein